MSSRKEKFLLPLGSCAWNNSINTCRLMRKRNTFGIPAYGGFIEMGPMKCPEQATFIIFGRRITNCEELAAQRILVFGCLISEESK